jgi:adenosylcobinamide-phosphate synthase
MNSFASPAVLLAAVLCDQILGEPPELIHPVVWMGRTIAVCNRFAPARGKVAQFAVGTLVAVTVPTGFAAAVFLMQAGFRIHPAIGFFASAALLKTTFALRALGGAAHVVRKAVAEARTEDAREALGALCSRDPRRLDGAALVAATVESVAENASDSFVAPLFWYAICGLPGAVFYRAANTLDAMIGYRGRYEWFGKAAARIDDALNFVPARITAILLLAAALLQGRNALQGARVLVRDGAATESPNAGRPMAVMAGVLGVVLAKPGHYRLGEPDEPLAPWHIDDAWRLTQLASVLAVLVTIGLIEVRYAIVR